MYTADDIRAFDGDKVNIKFTDGCSMNLEIVSIVHVDEGDDFVADVLSISCEEEKHVHPAIGTAINVRIKDVAAISRLESS